MNKNIFVDRIFSFSDDLGNMASKTFLTYVAFKWITLARKGKKIIELPFSQLAIIYKAPTSITWVSFLRTTY